MKKNILLLCCLFLVVLVSSMILYERVKLTKKEREKTLTIPSFYLSDINGDIVTERQLNHDKPVLFLYFDPGCNICTQEFNQIKLHQIKFQNKQIICFSTYSSDSISNYLKSIDFEPLSGMCFIEDKEAILVNYLNIKVPPTSLVYNSNGKLVKRFEGPVKAETLIRYLSE